MTQYNEITNKEKAGDNMMLQINCPIVTKIQSKIDGLELEGIKFKVKKQHALILDVAIEPEDGDKAKKVLQAYLSSLPEMGSRFLSIKITDESGRIL